MSNLTDRQLRDLIAPLHELGRRQVADGPTNLERLEQRIMHAVDRNRRSPAVRSRDGYPSGGGPGDGGEDAPQSSTEAAALTNLHGDTKDPIADHVENVIGYLSQAILSLGALTQRLSDIDKISDPRRTTNPAASCQACDRVVQCTSADPIRAGYCSTCSKAWYRWKDDETAAGREPDRPRFERWRREQLAA